MDHSLLNVWDLVIIGAYLILMVLVGVYSVRRIKNNDVMTDLDTNPVIWVASIICGKCMESVAKAWQNGPKMHEYMEASMDAKTFGWKEEGI